MRSATWRSATTPPSPTSRGWSTSSSRLRWEPFKLNFVSLCHVASVFPFVFTFCFLFFFWYCFFFFFVTYFFLYFDTFWSLLFCNFVFCVFVFVWFWPPWLLTAPLQLEAQEEKLRLEEEARNAAQREAARLARERKLKEVRRQTERSLQRVCSDCPE